MQTWIRRLVFPFWLLDARKKYHWIAASLETDDTILELGSGLGSVLQVLRQNNHQVVGVDIKNTSVGSDLAPIVYDGRNLPFANQSFDVCLLLTVLHHCRNPEQVLAEAIRVARRVIVIEDVYHNSWQRKFTHWLDSLFNWEFAGHPHSNRNDKAWRDTFRKLGMQVIDVSKYRVALVFCQVSYVLSRYQ